MTRPGLPSLLGVTFALGIVLSWASIFDAGVAIAAPARSAGGRPAMPLTWRLTTSSPEPVAVGASSSPLYAACGRADAALIQVATRNAAKQIRQEGAFASDELSFTLRAAGNPVVWPRLWSLEAERVDEPELAQRLTSWVKKAPAVGERRCGVARLRAPDGKTVVSAVTVDALADLEPLPTVARVGEWLTVRAHMLVPATEAKVVLLGPTGLPKVVLASLQGDAVRATFSVDQPGPWIIQILATVSTGPRPVLEAYVHAGDAPPTQFAESAAPGETAGSKATNDADALFAMVNAARKTEAIAPLARDRDLDKLAEDHAKRMLETKTVGHDVGAGDPHRRVIEAGIDARSTGENVAAASSLPRAHRALWASPSHRGNVLEKRFSRVGIGVARGEGGRVWVTEIFVGM